LSPGPSSNQGSRHKFPNILQSPSILDKGRNSEFQKNKKSPDGFNINGMTPLSISKDKLTKTPFSGGGAMCLFSPPNEMKDDLNRALFSNNSKLNTAVRREVTSKVTPSSICSKFRQVAYTPILNYPFPKKSGRKRSFFADKTKITGNGDQSLLEETKFIPLTASLAVTPKIAIPTPSVKKIKNEGNVVSNSTKRTPSKELASASVQNNYEKIMSEFPSPQNTSEYQLEKPWSGVKNYDLYFSPSQDSMCDTFDSFKSPFAKSLDNSNVFSPEVSDDFVNGLLMEDENSPKFQNSANKDVKS